MTGVHSLLENGAPSPTDLYTGEPGVSSGPLLKPGHTRPSRTSHTARTLTILSWGPRQCPRPPPGRAAHPPLMWLFYWHAGMHRKLFKSSISVLTVRRNVSFLTLSLSHPSALPQANQPLSPGSYVSWQRYSVEQFCILIEVVVTWTHTRDKSTWIHTHTRVRVQAGGNWIRSVVWRTVRH